MGSFAVLPLGEVVELLARRRATGTLTCERGTVRKALHLRDGENLLPAVDYAKIPPLKDRSTHAERPRCWIQVKR